MDEDNPYAPPLITREPPTKPVTLHRPETSTTFELTDLLIFTMISVMSFAWFQKSDPHGLFPDWSFYAAGVLYAAFVTYWGWVARIFNPDPPQPFIGKVVMAMLYMVPTWTIGHLTSLCIVYPTVLSIFTVPFGLFLYGVSLCVMTDPLDPPET